MTNKYQLFGLRDLIGEQLVKAARGKKLLEGLLGNFGRRYPEFHDAYYAKARLSWGSVGPILKDFMEGLNVAERGEGSSILCRMLGERAWIHWEIDITSG